MFQTTLRMAHAFVMVLPKVLFTNGDNAIYDALACHPASHIVIHLLCVYHLLDRNAMERIRSVLQAKGGLNAWPQFRHCLELCRKAGSEGELESFWRDMKEEWFEGKA